MVAALESFSWKKDVVSRSGNGTETAATIMVTVEADKTATQTGTNQSDYVVC